MNENYQNNCAVLKEATIQFREDSSTGIQISVRGEKLCDFSVDGGCVDVLGDFWDKLPAGMGTIAKMLAPIKVRLNRNDFISSKDFSTKFFIGYKSLHKETVRQMLTSVITKGDPIVAIELNFKNDKSNTDECLCLIPTKASLILKALDSGDSSSIIYNGILPNFSRRGTSVSKMLGFIRWWLFPLVLVVLSWVLWKAPSSVLEFCPQVLNHRNITIVEVLPPHPETLSAAFDLGMLEQKLCDIEKGKKSNLEEVAGILSQATKITGRKKLLTANELHAVRTRILEIEAHRGLITRVRGFFTFVNVLWLLAIAGMLVSVGPTVWHILKPFRKILERFIKAFVRKFLVPLLEFLHNWGFFELFSYVICWTFMAEGFRGPPDSGFFLSLTGLGGLVVAFGYSTALHGHKVSKEANPEALAQMMHSWLALCWTPFAIHFQSRFIGFMCVVAVYVVLGFNVVCFGLCYCIGFSKKEALQRCIVMSLLLLLLFGGLRIYGIDPLYLSPFSSAATIFGSVVLFLGLLIYSSRWYHGDYRSSNMVHTYVQRQIYMITSLIAACLVGALYSLEGMFNTGIVFLVLYVVEKYVELHVDMKWNSWLLVFLISVGMYPVALWLHQHPDFVVSVFNSVL